MNTESREKFIAYFLLRYSNEIGIKKLFLVLQQNYDLIYGKRREN